MRNIMETITIPRPVWIVKTDSKVISNVMSYIVEDYNDFDLKLMKKYFETRNLDDSHFTNI